MDKKKLRKIKSQKNAAILLIIGPTLMLINKTNLNKFNFNEYIISTALIVLIICGLLGLRNSLRKLKKYK